MCALAESYAGDSAAAPALFTSLRALGTAAWGMLAERCDRVGRILARDPVGVYPAKDAATRAHYRQTVARLARRTGRTEIEIAEDVLARAQSSEGARRHVGWFLLREVLGAPERRRAVALDARICEVYRKPGTPKTITNLAASCRAPAAASGRSHP